MILIYKENKLICGNKFDINQNSYYNKKFCQNHHTF